MKRTYMEYRDEQSAKFWEISVKGSIVTTRWGRIGADGQSNDKTFASPKEAMEAAEKLIRQKARKNYTTITGKHAAKKKQGKKAVGKKSAVRKGSAKTTTKKTVTRKSASSKSAPSKIFDPSSASQADLLKYVKSTERTSKDLASVLGKYVEVDRAIAKLENISTTILSKLSHCSDRATRAAVISNINVSPKVLVRLAPQFPKQFLSNPVLDLLLVENPGLLKALDTELLVQIVKQPECPESFLGWAARQDNEDVQLAVTMNEKSPKEIIESLASSKYESVKEAAESHISQAKYVSVEELESRFIEAVTERIQNLSLDELDELWKKKEINHAHFEKLPLLAKLHLIPCSSESVSVDQLNSKECNLFFKNHYYMRNISSFARYSFNDEIFDILGLPDGIIDLIANLPDEYERSRVAENPTCPEKLLEKLSLSSDKESYVQYSVANNANIPKSVLLSLAEDEDSEIRAAIARNDKCPADVLKRLAKDPQEDVRRATASNINLAVEILKDLSEDESIHVRAAVAGNTNCPKGLSLKLIESLANEKGVWHDLAENTNCPVAVLQKIVKSRDRRIRRAVAENPNFPTAEAVMLLKKLKDRWDRETPSERAARDKNTSPKLLAEMAKDKDWKLRALVAENPSIPAEALHNLSEDKFIEVRVSVAENLACPEDLLVRLALERQTSGRWSGRSPRCAVAGNPGCPISLLRELAFDEDGKIRAAVAGNPSAPADVLEQLANDKKEIRRVVAANPNLDRVVLDRLAHEKDRQIRLAVAFNPSSSVSTRVAALSHKDMKATIQSHYLPVSVLKKLRESELVEIREAALANTNHPVWQETLLNDLPSNPWFEKTLQKMPAEMKKAVEDKNILYFGGKDANKTVLSNRRLGAILALSDGARVTPERIARKSKSTDWLLRMAIARNIGTPPNILKRMESDGHVLVSSQAKYTRQLLSGDITPTAKAQKYDKTTVIKEIAARIRSAPSPLVSPLDPIWGRFCSLQHVWSEKGSKVLKDEWTQAEWEELAQYVLANLPKDKYKARKFLEPLLISEEFIRVLFKQAGRKKVVLEILASSPNLSEEVIEELSMNKDRWIRHSIAENPCTPVKILEILANDKEAYVRDAVSSNKNTPIDVAISLLTEDSWHIREFFDDRNPPICVLEQYSESKNIYHRIAVASYKETPIALLNKLSKDDSNKVRAAVAANENCPVDTIDKLSKDDSSKVRVALAANENCPVSIMDYLSNDKNHDVLEAIAENKNTPDKILLKIAKDANKALKKSIVDNKNCPIEVLRIFAKDKDWYIRYRVARHENCDVSLLNALSQDKDSNVRKGVASNPSTTSEILDSIYPLAIKEFAAYSELSQIAQHANASPEMLRKLAKYDNAMVRQEVAKNPNCPEEVFHILIKDKNRKVKQNVKDNPNSPFYESGGTDDIQKLSIDEEKWSVDEDINRLMKKKGAYSKLILESIREPELPSNVTDDQLLSGLVAVGCLPDNALNKDLTKASRSNDWLARFAVCLHPDATKSQLVLLMNDKDKNVSAAAALAMQAGRRGD